MKLLRHKDGFDNSNERNSMENQAFHSELTNNTKDNNVMPRFVNLTVLR